MSNLETQNDQNQLKQALSALKKARARLDSFEKAQKEPIAIIGIGCRFPGGANSSEEFWQLLANGVDAVSQVPADRWNIDALFDPDPSTPGKMSSRWGGFINFIDQFDPGFFGISPREAAQMDPQQRIMLEVAWEAIEDAGLTKAELAGSQTGVYVGVHSHSSDYTLYQYADPDAIDIYTGTGTAHNVIGGRLSYLFDLRGPSITVDTACSSSLVAVHLACQGLRTGESQMAIVGGVNLILSPEFTIAASKMHMLAPDGRCKAFDSKADGFVRGEGCGVVILKRLSDALANGDNIRALIRGSAINQDGHSNGLTAPNGLSQQAVIRTALEHAGVSPAEISYIEAHGTGTSLGDVIELESLAAVFGQRDREKPPCFLGSAKSNIGHLEGGAGIAGLIKTVLTLQKKLIPPVVHFKVLNPNVSLAGTPLTVPAEIQPWEVGQKRLAGISSFGWSGTNAHIILEEAPPMLEEKLLPQDDCAHLLPISAQSKQSLTWLAEAYRELLASENSAVQLSEVCCTASLRRSLHEQRLAVVGKTRQELAEKLNSFVQGKPIPGISSGYVAAEAAPRVAFVFPGQGSQWIGMGRELMAKEPVFRDALLECEKAIRLYVDWSLTEQLQNGSSSRVSDIDVIQPALFSIQVALAALWRSWGIIPDAVIGHSMGEVAAAYIAGALDLQNAARIICTRSQLMRRVSGKGVMAVVGLSLEEAERVVANYAPQLCVAVNNSPHSTVISGDPAAMDKLFEEPQLKNIFHRPVKVDVASHSAQMDPLLPELLKALDGLQVQPAKLPYYSTVSGSLSSGSALEPPYWADNLRKPVLFSKTVEKMLDDGYTIFIEISPHAILLTAIEETLRHLNKHGEMLPSLLREEPEQSTILSSLGKLYTLGYPIDWKKQYPQKKRLVPLPKYRWDHQRYWVKQALDRAAPSKNAQTLPGTQVHPLLGVCLPSFAHLPKSTVWQAKLDNRFRALLAKKTFEDVVTEMAFAAADSVFNAKTHLVRELHTHSALALSAVADSTLQFSLTREDASVSFELYQQQANSEAWTKLVDGRIEPGQVDVNWVYNVEWQPKPLPAGAAASNSKGNWWIFSDRSALGKEIGAALEADGQKCILSDFGSSPMSSVIQSGHRDEIRRVIEQSLQAHQIEKILFLWGLDALSNEELNLDALEKSQSIALAGLLDLIQSLLTIQSGRIPQVWVITRGAQPVVRTDPGNLAQSLLWGMGRAIAVESPDLWGGMIDLSSANGSRTEDVNCVLAEIFASDQEQQVAYRSGQRYVPRLKHSLEQKSPHPALDIHADAAYLITGGLGGLGLEAAHWLIDLGAKHIALTSRTGLPSKEEWDRIPAATPAGERIKAIRALEAKGATISVFKADVAQPLEMARLLETLASKHAGLRGILHIAGLEDYTPIQALTPEHFQEILRPKVAGAWVLHELSKSTAPSLDFFVMFSSAASVWGSKGLAHYSAANHFLDILAHHRRALGLPALSVNWGWWEKGGMGQGLHGQLFADVGLQQMSSQAGFAALKYLLETDAVESVVVSVDWKQFLPIYTARQNQPMFEFIAETGSVGVEGKKDDASHRSILQQLRLLPQNKQRIALLAIVRQEVANVLGLGKTDELDIQQGFFRLGMDSITTVRLRSSLENILDCHLPSTIAFEYPSVESLTDFLAHEIFAENTAARTKPAQIEAAASLEQDNQGKVKELSKAELFALLDNELLGIDKLLEGD